MPPQIQPITLGAFLAKLFADHRVSLTIVGGAAVQFYTQAEYVTHDLDAILGGVTKEIIEKVMGSLGFTRTSMYRHFENDLFKFVVEFPPSPVEVASRWLCDFSKIQTEQGEVRIIRIEDIIMDRITAAVEWRDQPSLDQAKLLWRKNWQDIDQGYLKKFAKEEGYIVTLRKVLKSFTPRQRKP